MYNNLYSGLSFEERSKIQSIDNNINYNNIRRSRAKKHTLDRSMECPFMKCNKCYASRTALKLHIKRCHDLKEPVKKNLKFSLISIVSSTSTKGVDFEKVIKKKVNKENDIQLISTESNSGASSLATKPEINKEHFETCLGKRKQIDLTESIDDSSLNEDEIVDQTIIEKNNKVKHLNHSRKGSKKRFRVLSKVKTSKSVQRLKTETPKKKLKNHKALSSDAKIKRLKKLPNANSQELTNSKEISEMENGPSQMNEYFNLMHNAQTVTINRCSNNIAKERNFLNVFSISETNEDEPKLSADGIYFMNDTKSLLNSPENDESYQDRVNGISIQNDA